MHLSIKLIGKILVRNTIQIYLMLVKVLVTRFNEFQNLIKGNITIPYQKI